MENENKKVSIIGAGYVGSGIANALTLKNLADEIVLIDINNELANAEKLDIRHGIPEIGRTKVICGDYSDIVDSDLIIITAGRNRKNGETRLDLTADNIKIAKSIVQEVKKYYNSGVVLVVSNPVDIITYFVTKELGLNRGKVFGSGCVLDTSRFVNLIADYTGADISSIEACVLGEHGESQIPLWSRVRVNQIPIEISETEKEFITNRVKNLGAEIISGKGKTFYGISTCVSHIVDAILNNRKKVLTVTSVLENEYGITDVALSVPSLVDKNGIAKIVGIELAQIEADELKNSANSLKEIIESLCSKN